MPEIEDPAAKPIEISANAGLIDGLQAAARYIGFLITAVVAVLGLLKTRDIAGLIAYVQANGGQIAGAVSGLIALAIAAYGVFKTRKRGAQLATAGADPAVPNRVITVK